MEMMLPKKIALKMGTTHTTLSDIEEVESWPSEVTWIYVVEKSETQLMDTIEAIVRRDTPQRVSVPGLQKFCGVMPVDKLFQLVDRIMACFVGTQHQVIIPTVRFIPSSFMFWEACYLLNRHIWSRAVQHGFGGLNLHRNFMQRQRRSWAVHGPCYQEYCEDTGFGTSLSQEGLKRYAARLVRLHSNGFDCEHPQVVPAEEMPVPLWSSVGFCQSASCSELLESLGYRLDLPKKLGKARQQERPVQKEVQAVVPRAAKRGRSESVGPESGRASRPGRGRGRGRVPARDGSGRPISTLQLEAGTVRSMIKQIRELKVQVQEKDGELQRAKEIRRELEKDLERAQDDVRRKENVVAVMESRQRADSRSLRRERQAQWEEHQEWLRQRNEWQEERRNMLDMYERLHGKHHELKGQFSVFKEVAGMERAEKKARKEKK